jgi:hypothetical protein
MWRIAGTPSVFPPAWPLTDSLPALPDSTLVHTADPGCRKTRL